MECGIKNGIICTFRRDIELKTKIMEVQEPGDKKKYGRLGCIVAIVLLIILIFIVAISFISNAAF